MKHFSDKSCEQIMRVSTILDNATNKLDMLPESERLSDIIEQLSGVIAKLDDIIKDEQF